MVNIIIFCSHSDDEIVGAGGTIAKLSKKNKIIKIVFSSGQSSHPHLKGNIIIKRRIKETENIDKLIGISETIYFGLTDTKIYKEIEEFDIKEKVRKLIKKYNPKKIYVPSSADPHLDHKAANKIVIEILEDIKDKPELYSYEVWNITQENNPVVYEDISKYFSLKLKAMMKYETQWISMYTLAIPVYVRARYYGYKNKCQYAEKFYKLL